MLYGPPGSGKSSTIKAIAGHFKKDLYILDLSDKDLTDPVLLALVSNVPNKGILLIEDIDAAFVARDSEASKGISFSGLLNALDGVASKDGRITFMTTNHIEKLDPALIRPGRVDLQIKIDNASNEQCKEIYLRFFPGEEVLSKDFAEIHGGGIMSMASIQNLLLRSKDDPYKAAYST